jgi:hypothetical protein
MARKKPTPKIQKKDINRGREYKRDDSVKNVSVEIMDMDSAIMYYFNNVIQPTVEESGEQVKVPVLYANPERWNSIRKTGYLRDKKRQLMTPLIVFQRTGMEKNTSIPVDKLDANDPKLHYTFGTKWSKKNRYDKLSVQQNLIPQNEFYNVVVPDYMVLNYDFIIWTSFMEQMNKLIEKINFSAGAYWGEPGKMKFRTIIETFTDATEVADNERTVKTEFSVILNGYLLPKSYNDLLTTQKYLSPKRMIMKEELM